MSILEQLEFLQNVGEKASKRTAEVLGELMNLNVNMEISKVDIMPIENLPEEIGEEKIVVLRIDFSGHITGTAMVMLDINSAHEMAQILMEGIEKGEKIMEFTYMEQSCINEIGNIIVASFIDTIANELGVELNMSPPLFLFDFGSAIVQSTIVDILSDADFAIVFNTRIDALDKEKRVNCSIIVLPKPSDIEKLSKPAK